MGGRTTRQRRAVLRALADCQDFVSAQELHALLVADAHAIGLTTVYRALRASSPRAVTCIAVPTEPRATSATPGPSAAAPSCAPGQRRLRGSAGLPPGRPPQPGHPRVDRRRPAARHP
ncbi:transcriptional repressor [Streptomyces sp. NPDC002845]